MKFTITADALADAAGFAAKGIAARPAMPILGGLLIEAQQGGLRISGFDYEKSARTQVAADVDTPGSVLLQGKMFADIIKKFGKKTVTISVEGRRATLKAGSAVFTMAAMPVEDFPAMPDLPPVVGKVDGTILAAAVGQVIGAASTDFSLAILCSVQIVSEGDTLTLRTTDRYRLAEVSIPWQPAGEDISLVVKAGWLGDVVKTLAGEASILNTENLVGIRTGNRATTVTAVDGDYPKIKTLFPDHSPIEITVDRSEFADVLSRVALVAERNTPVKLTTSGGSLTVEAGTGEDATGREVIQCNVSGDDIALAFNPAYLAWSLSVTPADEVTLGIQDDQRKPALITGHDGLRHLLMPVRL
ncbi:DNA polymerase iii sliding clamp [Arthrobacter phage Persistence]|uniref:DNA polymerase III sliding clamp n=1 Tax=Arthrobacter phage Persistence TaxID=2836007 RepID=A0A8F3E2V5_9CAUD|nr:DNA polymerase iii sliding clamp [Arthrobacter phage Persistence]QWY79699.1 DNA polymerase III sliding clamp [Arthrobacter phage Persistence]